MPLKDANFEETVANSSILKLYELKKWCEEMINDATLVDSAEQYIDVRDNNRVKNIDAVATDR